MTKSPQRHWMALTGRIRRAKEVPDEHFERSAQSGFFWGRRPNVAPTAFREAQLSNENFRDLLDLLKPGNPSDIPQNLWDAWKQDEMYVDYMVDAGRIEEGKRVLASLEDDPELLDQILERAAKIRRDLFGHVSRLVKLRYTSNLKRQILLALLENPDADDREVCRWLDFHWEDDLPYSKPFIKAYDGKEKNLLQSAISKVRSNFKLNPHRQP